MTTFVERSIEVEVPVRTAYDQWTQFEEFPRFMAGVQEVTQIGDALTHWVADIGGVKREWDAAILEQVPDEKVAWAATSGATNAGAVYFTAVGDDRTQVRLTLEFEPEGIVERIGDVFDIVDRQAVSDLDRFKAYIEQAGSATGGWRGTVDDGEVQSGGAGAGGAGPIAAGGAPGLSGAAAGVVSGAAAGAGVGDAGFDESDTAADDVPGDLVAVGPTGGTHSTLETEPGPARIDTADDEGPGVEHSGDPVAVEPPSAGGRNAGEGVGPSGDTAVDDVPGDLVAVGPTGDTRGTVETEPGPARVDAAEDEDPSVGHSGDPVAVEPPDAGGGRREAAIGPLGEPWSPDDAGEGAHRRVAEPGAAEPGTTGMGGAVSPWTEPDDRPSHA